MSSIRLLSARYSRLDTPFSNTIPIEDRIASLAHLIGRDVDRVLSRLDLRGDYDHVLCSTIASHLVTQSEPQHQQFLDVLAARVGHAPLTVVKSYECASWGYVLRFLSMHRRSRFALVTIVDIDIHGLTYWRYHPMWERSGFGILTLAIALADDISGELEVDAVPKANALIGFGRSLARFADGRGEKLIFSPFFPQAQWTAFQRALGGLSLAKNQHSQFGHCFGSDPWVNLICGVQSGVLLPGETAIAASLSLSGYYAFAEVELAQGAVMELDTLAD